MHLSVAILVAIKAESIDLYRGFLLPRAIDNYPEVKSFIVGAFYIH